MILDELCTALVTEKPNLHVSWMLVAAYAYYVEDEPILSDACYDRLARYVAANYSTLDHIHTPLIPPPTPGSPIVHLYGCQWPSRLKGAVRALRESVPA